MQEITLKPAEIKLIDPRRTSLIPYQRKQEKPITASEYRRMIKKLSFICGLEFGVISVLAVMNYILQAGSI